MEGASVYADFISGRIWVLRLDAAGSASNELILESGLGISSFNRDAAGELYLCTFDGRLCRLRAAEAL